MLHFTQTTAFSTAVLEASALLDPANAPALEAEADVGIRWLLEAHPYPRRVRRAGRRRARPRPRLPRSRRRRRRRPAGHRHAVRLLAQPGPDRRRPGRQGRGGARDGLPAHRRSGVARRRRASGTRPGSSPPRRRRPSSRPATPTTRANFYHATHWADSMATGALELYRATGETSLPRRLRRATSPTATRGPTGPSASSRASPRSAPRMLAERSVVRRSRPGRRSTSAANCCVRTARSPSSRRARTPSACPASSPGERPRRTAAPARSRRLRPVSPTARRAGARSRPARATTCSAATRSGAASSSATARRRRATRITGPRCSARASPPGAVVGGPAPLSQIRDQGFKAKSPFNSSLRRLRGRSPQLRDFRAGDRLLRGVDPAARGAACALLDRGSLKAMANRLADETSPYLLQHKDNPVDWYPWGDEALERAVELDRPMLLSIGYSACHWCHVMERESFENAEIARFMNEHFVCIKVDREERPDVDAIYMEAVQAMTGHGGWPLTAFCDPDGRAVLHRHLLPARAAPGDAELSDGARGGRAVVGNAARGDPRRGRADPQPARHRRPDRPRLRAALPRPARRSRRAVSLDRRHAQRRLRLSARSSRPPRRSSSCSPAARPRSSSCTLDAMAAGGIHDQIGGGFARYSVDPVWLVPHFEKMLYDNALLARAYLHGYQALGHSRWRQVTERTLDWMLAEMRGPEGGFFSALDADSEGVEGKFYVWTPAEIREVLGDERRRGHRLLRRHRGAATSRARTSCISPAAFDTEPPAGIDEARRALYEVRSKRVWPGLDDKRLLAWNALAIAALADAGAVLGRDDYLDAARAAAEFVWTHDARRRRQPPAHLEGRRGEAQRLPRGPRVPASRRCSTLYESTLRAALVRRGARDRRPDDRPLRRPRARRLLHHLRRPRGADRPAQGPRRPPDPERQLVGRRTACCASKRSPARPPTASTPARCSRSTAGSPRATRAPSRTCSARSTSIRPPCARSRWSRRRRRRPERSASSPRSSAPNCARTLSSPAASRARAARS